MGLAEPEFRQVTVAYLHELYDEIRQHREDAAVRALFEAVGRDPDRPVGRNDAVPNRLIRAIAKAKPSKRHQQKQAPAAAPMEVLTTRERQVLEYASRGLTEAMTADALHLSPFTVHTHMRTARFKLAAKTSAHACCEAIRAGLIR